MGKSKCKEVKKCNQSKAGVSCTVKKSSQYIRDIDISLVENNQKNMTLRTKTQLMVFVDLSGSTYLVLWSSI